MARPSSKPSASITPPPKFWLVSGRADRRGGRSAGRFVPVTQRVFSDLSKVQDDEVGDGTTSVTVLAAELLRVKRRLFCLPLGPAHSVTPPVSSNRRRSFWCPGRSTPRPSSPAGGRPRRRRGTRCGRRPWTTGDPPPPLQAHAAKPSLFHLHGSRRLRSNDSSRFQEDLLNIARTTLSSKLLTHHKDHFAQLAVDAVIRLKGSGNLDAIHVIKKLGGSLTDSYLDEGERGDVTGRWAGPRSDRSRIFCLQVSCWTRRSA